MMKKAIEKSRFQILKPYPEKYIYSVYIICICAYAHTHADKIHIHTD